MAKKWESYEQVAQYLLDRVRAHLGLERVEGKQTVPGASGATWEIDAKGVKQGASTGIIVIEVKRYTTSRIQQGVVAELAYKISDTGGEGGILVSPLGFQEGAKVVAESEGVIEVMLAPDSTRTDYFLAFLNRVFVGVSETVHLGESVIVVKIDRETGRVDDTLRLGG
jgi:hypothetical protein